MLSLRAAISLFDADQALVTGSADDVRTFESAALKGGGGFEKSIDPTYDGFGFRELRIGRDDVEVFPLSFEFPCFV